MFESRRGRHQHNQDTRGQTQVGKNIGQKPKGHKRPDVKAGRPRMGSVGAVLITHESEQNQLARRAIVLCEGAPGSRPPQRRKAKTLSRRAFKGTLRGIRCPKRKRPGRPPRSHHQICNGSYRFHLPTPPFQLKCRRRLRPNVVSLNRETANELIPAAGPYGCAYRGVLTSDPSPFGIRAAARGSADKSGPPLAGFGCIGFFKLCLVDPIVGSFP